MRRFLLACLLATPFVAPAVFTTSALAQADAIPAPPVEAFFRYEGRVYRASLSITTYIPGILIEGQTSAASTYASFSIQSLDGQQVPAALNSSTLILNTRRRGQRLPLRPSEVALQVVGYAAYFVNFTNPLPAGQRLGARIEFQTPRGRIELNFNTVVVGLATPLA